MIRVTQLKLQPGAGEDQLTAAVRKALHLKESEAFSYEVLRRSIDARKKPELYEVFTVLVQPEDARVQKRILRSGLKHVDAYEPVRYRYGLRTDDVNAQWKAAEGAARPGESLQADRPLIVGTGPAGLFCALLLAREGLRPILIERGKRAAERVKCVKKFWETGNLNSSSNVQFGEGGAGTFSDGKLNTGVKDPYGRIRFVLQTFVDAGADPQILSSAKPHIGTDVLKMVVTNLTDEICSLGAEAFFETRVDKIRCEGQGIWKVSCTSGAGESISFTTRHLVLAIGHSARDTFAMLKDSGILITPKAFAVGIRIQHPQEMIDRALYGESCRYSLPAASYKLTHRLRDGGGVYSFCMCPGGYVVNASSERGHLAVNGMSQHDRASGSANSAIVVALTPEEIAAYFRDGFGRYAPEHAGTDSIQKTYGPLIGMEFQRRLEKSAYEAGEGAIPVQRFGDFLRSGASSDITFPGYQPQFAGKWTWADLGRIFPDRILEGIEEGILAWERQIKGFSSPDALLSAVESRTSSPVRIERGKDLQAVGRSGLYPCGEGAGYAGGITSAAVDGLKVAEQIMRDFF